MRLDSQGMWYNNRGQVSGADAVASPDLIDGAAGIGFFQDRHDLCFGERRLAHGDLLAKGLLCQKILLWACLRFRGAYALLSSRNAEADILR